MGNGGCWNSPKSVLPRQVSDLCGGFSESGSHQLAFVEEQEVIESAPQGDAENVRVYWQVRTYINVSQCPMPKN